MSLAEVVAAVRKNEKVDVVSFGDNWMDEYNLISDTIQQGYALEWFINAYCMFLPFNGVEYRVVDSELQEVISVSDIDLGKRGKDAVHQPDAVLSNNSVYTLVSCKRDKVGHRGLDGSNLAEFNNKVLGGRKDTKYMGVSSDLAYMANKKKKGDFSIFIDHSVLKNMWTDFVKEVRSCGNSFKTLEKRKKKTLIERDAVQKYLKDECVEKYNYTNKVWLNAIMRSGKSYIFALIACHFSAGRIIIMSHFPTDTFAQWKEIFAKSNQYSDYDLFMADEVDVDTVKKSKRYVIVCSAQRIKTSPEWNKFVKNTRFDFAGYDEVHYGYTSDLMTDIMDNMKVDKWLMMSGTIDVLISNGLVNANDVVEWTYMDTQMCKKGFNPKLDKYKTATDNIFADFVEKTYPTLNIAHLEPNRLLLGKLIGNDALDDVQSWDKIYRKPAVLKAYVRLMLGDSTIQTKEEKKVLGKMVSAIDMAAGHKFILWFCPGKNEMKTLQDVIENIQEENPGSSISSRIVKKFNSDNEDGKFKDTIKLLENDDKEYIILLCGQGTTGISYKDAPVEIIGRDCSSITLWLQMIFRVMTAMPVACDRWVYDLSFGHIFVDNVSGFIRSNRCVHADQQIKQLFHFVNITEGFGTWDYAAFENKRKECFSGRTDLLMGSIVRGHQIGDLLAIPEDIDTKTAKTALPTIGEPISGKSNFEGSGDKKKKGEGEPTGSEGKEEEDKLLRDKALQMFLLKALIKTSLTQYMS